MLEVITHHFQNINKKSQHNHHSSMDEIQYFLIFNLRKLTGNITMLVYYRNNMKLISFGLVGISPLQQIINIIYLFCLYVYFTICSVFFVFFCAGISYYGFFFMNFRACLDSTFLMQEMVMINTTGNISYCSCLLFCVKLIIKK